MYTLYIYIKQVKEWQKKAILSEIFLKESFVWKSILIYVQQDIQLVTGAPDLSSEIFGMPKATKILCYSVVLTDSDCQYHGS